MQPVLAYQAQPYRSLRLGVILVALLALLPWRPVAAQPAAPVTPAASDLQLVKVVDGLSQPVYVADPGDGSNRLFVVEKAGTIRIIKNGTLLPDPFLDISARVGTESEAGLLSIAFPADFATAKVFFVYYNHSDKNLVRPEPIDAGNNAGNDTVIARFRVSSNNPDRADAASEQRILVRNQPYVNHKGGLIKFGPDGYLYIGLGDGGSGGDPQNQAQSLTTILGKILRIQVGATGTYTIPADNPFAGAGNGARGEIWDYGLRNPWRWSFDRTTGDLYIADVGQNKFEEVDFHAAGAQGGINFGWRCREGFAAYNENPPCTGALTNPILAYGRDEGQSITGGYVYRGTAYPTLAGKYFYGDFSTGRIWSVMKLSAGWSKPQLELDTNYNISSFGQDAAGELYLTDYSDGVVYKITSTAAAPNVKLHLPQISK